MRRDRVIERKQVFAYSACLLCLLCLGGATMSLSPPAVAARCRLPSPPPSLPLVSVRRRFPGIVSAQFRRPPSQYAVESAYSATIGEGGTTLPTLWGWGWGNYSGGGGGGGALCRSPSPPAVAARRLSPPWSLHRI